MATLLSDSFTRADSTNVPGTPTIGGPYTVRVGTWGINGNAMYTSVSTAESIITYPSAVDVDISCTSPNSGGSWGIVHGWASANDYWLFQLNANTVQMHRKVGGTFGARSAAVAVTAPVTLRLVTQGPILRAYAAGNLVTVIEEAMLPSGNPAVSGFRSSSSTANRFDDLIAIDTAAASTITGGLHDTPRIASDPVDKASYVIKGRDRKSLDTTSAA